MTTNERAGGALVLASVVGAIAMTFHPSGHDVIGAAIHSTSNIRDVVVHLVAIAAELTLLLGTLVLTVRLAQHRELAISGFVVYATAIVSLVVAAVASGLIAPAIASDIAKSTDPQRGAMSAMFLFNAEVNQAFAKLGFSLAAVAIILWSIAMVRGGFSRSLGAYGIAMGGAVLVALAASGAPFVLHGAGGLVMAGEGAWMIAAGLLLRRS